MFNKELSDMKYKVNEKIDESVFQWFGHIERIMNRMMGKKSI